MENELKELTAIYSDLAAAFQNKDLDVIAKYTAPDWTGSHGQGTVTRAQLLENVRGQFQNLDEISWPRTLSDARLEGDKATVKAEGTFTAIRKDSGELLKMELANEDTWRCGLNGWQIVNSKELEASRHSPG